ncbi:MAG: hypothetical protein AAFV95_17440 [Bacteroidota bacterium]
MKKSCLLIAFVVFGMASLSAQGKSNTFAVLPLTTSFEQDEEQADYSKMLTETILTSIVQSQRFTMVDFTDVNATLKVLLAQNPENPLYESWGDASVSESHLVEAGKRLGIEYIFVGNISNVSVSIAVSGLYRAEFGFTLKVISVASGRIYVTESFAVSSDKRMIDRFGGKDSKREALNAALQNVNEPISIFLDKYFPIEARFFKIKKSSRKGVPTVVVIKGGLTNGLRNKQKLDVVLKENISSDDGEGNITTYRDKIAEIRIMEIESNFATCKVLKGGEEIKNAFEKEKEKMFAQSQSYVKKGLF